MNKDLQILALMKLAIKIQILTQKNANPIQIKHPIIEPYKPVFLRKKLLQSLNEQYHEKNFISWVF